ncbi:MAG TPA: glutamate-1-semialdehyde 2,1-aminomutase [Limnochordales bacterium]
MQPPASSCTPPTDIPVGEHSRQWFRRAEQVIVGGVNSPSRSLEAVGGGAPPFMVRGEGAYLVDVDGRRYIDYVQGFGALILGHGHPALREAIQEAAAGGTLFGTCHPGEVLLAEALKAAAPEVVERVRFTASGTEAVMTAVRLARAATGRRLLVKFDGSYHGHFDAVLVGAGSGASTLGLDESAGVPDGVKADVLSLPYNDPEAFAAAVRRAGRDMACVLVEPVVGNFGLVLPRPGFLETVVEQAHRAGALVIFDEVITAFRFRPGAVYRELGVVPDLITFGKLVGGGLPIGAYAGPSRLMDLVAPKGPVYQDGTWAGNPASVAAGLAAVRVLTGQPELYARLEELGRQLAQGVRERARRWGVPAVVHQKGGAVCLYFTEEPDVTDFAGVARCDGRRFARFFQAMLRQGILLPPSPYEVWFLSAAHGPQEVERTLQAADRALKELAG